MFELKYVSKSNDKLIQFLQENLSSCVFYKCKSWNFLKFIFKLRVFSEEILILDILLVVANLNR